MFRRLTSALAVAILTVAIQAAASLAAEPSSDTPVSRVMFGSCIQQDQPIPILQTMLRENPQLVIFLGDNIYADTADREVMRSKYATLAANEDFAALRQASPILATWDDHDYGQNDSGEDYPQREAAEQLFLDFWGDPPDSPRRQRPGVYDAHIFGPPGRRLQVILLDTRYFRSPLKQGEKRLGGPHVPDDDPAKTLLGEAQWQWLETQLNKPAEFRVIASSIQCVASDAGQETWSNFPRERDRLFRLIGETGASGVVIVSGDRHWAELSVATRDVPYPLYDLTSSSFNQIHPRGTPTENQFRATEKTYHRENFGVISIDWDAPDPAVSLQVRDMDNQVQIEQRVRLSELQAR